MTTIALWILDALVLSLSFRRFVLWFNAFTDVRVAEMVARAEESL